MKRIVFVFLILACMQVRAQSVVGYWYGMGTVNVGKSANNYMMELIVKQSGNTVQGILNYYFRNSYRSMQVKGYYNTATREMTLNNVPLPYFGSTDEIQVDCSMDFVATHRVAKAGSNLSGRFIGKEGYRYTCPDIVFDFNLNTEAGNQDSVLLALKNFKETRQLWTPSSTDTVVAATVQQRKIENIVVNKEFKERQSEVQNEISVMSDSLAVDFYDNGEVDGDSISVFFNNQLLGANLRLSTHAIHLNIKLDSTKEVNTLSMFANNLGSIPPNTALMLIYDGKNRYEARLSSNLQMNAAVNIRRKKPVQSRRP
jgi:hypothetical protein